MKRSNTMIAQTEVCVPVGDEEDCRIVFWEFSPFDPGVCSGPVEACYPAEGGELKSAAFSDGTDAIDWMESHGVFDAEDHDAFEKALRDRE